MKKFLLTLVFGLSLLATPALAVHGGNHELPPTVETYESLNLFGEIFNLIRSNHVDVHVDKELIDEAIKGMIKALDKHSSYLTPEQFIQMQESTSGRYFGIGAEVDWSEEKKVVIMVRPMEGSPAEKAGIKPGDIVYEIDGVATSKIGDLRKAVKKIKGPRGTDVILTVIRDGVEKPIKITVIRGEIQQKTVRFRIINDSIMYIRLSQFSQQSSVEVAKAIVIMKAGIDGGATGLFLDFRNNPGGLLDQAIAIVDMFLDEGMIVETRPRNSDGNSAVFARPGQIVRSDLPIIILINKNSASASEIVAGTLKDLNRATLVGAKSYGKGSVQSVIPLFNGGALRLTVAKYYTAGGTTPHDVGIDPDVVLELPDEYWKDIPRMERRTHIDPQLQKAIDVLEAMVGNAGIIPVRRPQRQ